jgi:hypothetical protein
MAGDRVFVGFSSTDIKSYRLMTAWKANGKIDFEFTDCQLSAEVNSDNEDYIKRKVRERLGLAGTFVQLIGEDTRSKYKYVRREAEVAITERKMRIIGVNLNGSRLCDDRCPPVLKDIGALFVTFNPAIIQYALKNFERQDKDNWHYKDGTYTQLGL